MTDVQPQVADYASRYVPAGWLPGYDEICPLAPQHGHVNGNEFTFRPVVGHTILEPVTKPLADTLPEAPLFLILELGLIEHALEEPVRKAGDAIEAELKLLFGYCGGAVVRDRIRTTPELAALMTHHPFAGEWTHIIIVGHGGADGLGFIDHTNPTCGTPLQVGGIELASLLGCDSGCTDCQIISFCCHSGCGDVVAELSKAPNVTEVVAPTETFGVSWTASFISGYFQKLYRSGEPRDVALQLAASWCAETPMAIWRDGTQV